MATTKVVLKKKAGKYLTNDNGESVIYIRYGHGGKTVLFSSGIKVNPKHWNGEKDQMKFIKSSLSGYTTIINVVSKKRSEIAEISAGLKFDGVEPTTDRVKLEIDGSRESKEFKQKDIITLFNEFVESAEDVRSTNTVKNYKVCLMHLKKFVGKKPLTLDQVNIKFIEDLRRHLIKKEGLLNNTVEGIIKGFKAFLSSLNSHGHELNLEPSNIKIRWEEPQIIFLTQSELTQLYQHNYSRANLEAVRDLFVFACCTGFRYSDLSRVASNHISGDVIKLKAYKNKSMTYVPIIPRTREILEKYDYQLPRYQEPVYNRLLKEACKEAGINSIIEIFEYKGGNKEALQFEKWQKISSHKAVSTFITHALENGVPAKHVARITGKTIKVINKHYAGVDDDSMTERMLKAFA